MEYYSIQKYIDSGCPEIKDDMGKHLWAHTRGKICDTGCVRFNDGSCKAYRNLVFKHKKQTIGIETVRQEAKRRNISITQVRKQRRGD